MTMMDRESMAREQLRDAAPELLEALVAMLETHDGPPAGSYQRGARLNARKVLIRAGMKVRE